MPDYTLKTIDDMYGTYGGAFKHARAELGVTSFGMQFIDLPPNFDGYPEHVDDEQEEVFMVISGSAEGEFDGEKHQMDSSSIVRVGKGVKRMFRTGEEHTRILCLGGIPGSFQAAPNTELDAPDPLAG